MSKDVGRACKTVLLFVMFGQQAEHHEQQDGFARATHVFAHCRRPMLAGYHTAGKAFSPRLARFRARPASRPSLSRPHLSIASVPPTRTLPDETVEVWRRRDALHWGER